MGGRGGGGRSTMQPIQRVGEAGRRGESEGGERKGMRGRVSEGRGG